MSCYFCYTIILSYEMKEVHIYAYHDMKDNSNNLVYIDHTYHLQCCLYNDIYLPFQYIHSLKNLHLDTNILKREVDTNIVFFLYVKSFWNQSYPQDLGSSTSILHSCHNFDQQYYFYKYIVHHQEHKHCQQIHRCYIDSLKGIFVSIIFMVFKVKLSLYAYNSFHMYSKEFCFQKTEKREWKLLRG